MTSKTHQSTIRDVAAAAGVSVSTVSRVLNQKSDVSEETQQRIELVIRDLGYTSNLAARSMRSKKSNLIGLILPDVEHPYSQEILKGVNNAIARQKYDLLIFTSGDFRKQDTALHEQEYISTLNGTITDGVIVVSPSASTYSSPAPIVSIDPILLNPLVPTILADHYAGALELMRYLVKLKHKRIGYISGREGFQNQERFQAYKDVLEESGIGFSTELISAGDFSTSTGAICAKKLLSLKNPPSAIFASNDQSALGVIGMAKQMGIRISEDLSLAGFDDIPEAKYLDLTTVSQPLFEMGKKAVEILVERIAGDFNQNLVMKLPTQLVIRNSCQVFRERK